jgi:uncharacterized membrane protein
MYLGMIGSLLGLCVSLYIYHQKRKKKTLICPREGNCEKVVHSTHATTFGINNEILGVGFYVLQAVLWSVMLVAPQVVSGWYLLLVVLLTAGGVLFSVYLIALQALVIRAWCMWCLGSSAAVLLLTIAVFGIPGAKLFAVLTHTRLWWVIIHNIGFILGLGGATITDIFFFRFLKDGVISETEKQTMDTLSNVIWIGLAILIVSGIMLYLPEQARLGVSSKFLLKVVVVSVVTINGIFLNILVAPRMRTLSLLQTPPARHFRRLAFALGGISITSWYVAFFLGSFRKISLALREGIALYVCLLIAVVIGSQVYERIVTRKNPTT